MATRTADRRMALAAATHHSAQQNAAPRGPKTGARAREGVEHEQHDGPRAQKPPLPGVRPGSLFDPGPQRSARTVRRSAGDGLPTPGLPVLAGASGEAVDASTLRFLAAAVLYSRKLEEEVRKSEEEEKKAKEEEMQKAAVPGVGKWVELVDSDTGMTYFWNPQTNATRWTLPGSSSSSSTSKRKKKKRKRKLPKCGLFPPGCGRPCDHRQVPALQVVHVHEGAPASVHRQSGGHSCYACRDVYPQCELCSSSSAVPLPDIGDVGFGSSPYLDTIHTIYELCLPSERVFVAMSCGGGFFTPDGTYDSTWCSVRPRTGKYVFNYFQYQEFVVCICMLNYCLAATTRFAQACVAVRSGSCFCSAI